MRSPDVTDEMIIASYQKLHSMKKVAEELDIAEQRARRVLWKHKVPCNGLEIYREAAQSYPESIQREMTRLHQNGLSLAELRVRFGGSKSSVRAAIERHGVIFPGITTKRQLTEQNITQILSRYASGDSQDSIAVSIGYSQTLISRILRENNIVIRGKNTGDKHPNWKGGRAIHGNGYLLIQVSPDDPMASMRNRSGYVLEHRLNMARKLGRPLRRSETVHHIDGNHENNHPDNLQLRQGRHGKGVIMCCGECGSHNIHAVPIT